MRFGRPVSESCMAWYSFSACFAASFDVASCRECVRRNIWRANASGAAKTMIASATWSENADATRTANSARPMYDSTNSPNTPWCMSRITDRTEWPVWSRS